MILEAITIVFGLFYVAVGFIWGWNILTFFPSVTISLIGVVSLFNMLKWNCYVLCINDYNGKKVFKLNNGKKYYNKSKNKAGYYIKVEGFSKSFPYPDQKYVNLNLTHRRPFFCIFYQESDQLAPIETKYSKEQIEKLISSGQIKEVLNNPDGKTKEKYKPIEAGFDVDKVNFISSELIANHYQMKGVVKEMVKPPTDTLTALVNIGLLICMLGAIITNVYIAGKLGLNVDVINGVTEKIDQMIGSVEDLVFRLEGGINDLVGVAGESIDDVPPITGG